MRKKTAYTNYNVVVVDNGSVDDSVTWVKEHFPWVEVISLDKNYGFSIGNNRGINFALNNYDIEYILLLNNDTEIVQENWLRKIVTFAESEETVGIVGCKLLYPDGRIQYIGTKLTITGLSWLRPCEHKALPETYSVDAILGACFLIKRSVIDKIGGLDAGFSPFNDEESDFCMRAIKVGYRICMVSTAEIVHLCGTSMGKINSKYVRLVKKRNSIRFMLLNFPASWLAKRIPYEVRSFIRCFIARNNTIKNRIPIKLRDSQDMLIEVETIVRGWLYNLKSLNEIAAKRQNRTMRLPLV